MLEARKAGEGSAHATSLITGSEIDVRRRTRATTPPSSTIFPNPIIYSPVRETLNPRSDELFWYSLYSLRMNRHAVLSTRRWGRAAPRNTLSKKLRIFMKRSTLWRITWDRGVFVSHRCERKGRSFSPFFEYLCTFRLRCRTSFLRRS